MDCVGGSEKMREETCTHRSGYRAMSWAMFGVGCVGYASLRFCTADLKVTLVWAGHATFLWKVMWVVIN